MVAVRFKHALITVLLISTIFSTIQSEEVDESSLRNPVCEHPPLDSNNEMSFMFFVDLVFEPSMVSRLIYIAKAISCFIPVSPKMNMLVAHYAPGFESFSDLVTSDKLPEYLYKDPVVKVDNPGSACSRFRSVRGNAPPTFLEKKNAQFIVPMIEDKNDPDCSFLKVFQEQYKNDLRKDNFYFSGILINSDSSPKNEQSVRIIVPDLMKAVELNRSNLTEAGGVGNIHDSNNLVQSYRLFMNDMMSGNIPHDWEEILTSSLSPKVVTTTKTPGTVENMLFDEDIDDEIVIPSANGTNSSSTQMPSTPPQLSTRTTVRSSPMTTNNTSTGPTTSSPSSKATETGTNSTNMTTDATTTKIYPKRAPLPIVVLNTTTFAETTEIARTTLENVNSTTLNSTAIDDYDSEDEGEDLGMASGKSKGEQSDDYFTLEEITRKELDADLLIYVIILLLLIWLFCLFLCLVWMFSCAKNKQYKIQDEAEQQQQQVPLLENGHDSKVSSKSVSNESDEADDEWKNIKPARYIPSNTSTSQSKSEMESVKQPSLRAQIAPVEVSEFEDKLDDELDERPRHGGYYAAKRTADLRFD